MTERVRISGIRMELGLMFRLTLTFLLVLNIWLVFVVFVVFRFLRFQILHSLLDTLPAYPGPTKREAPIFGLSAALPEGPGLCVCVLWHVLCTHACVYITFICVCVYVILVFICIFVCTWWKGGWDKHFSFFVSPIYEVCMCVCRVIETYLSN